jgi:hypothetical protein
MYGLHWIARRIHMVFRPNSSLLRRYDACVEYHITTSISKRREAVEQANNVFVMQASRQPARHTNAKLIKKDGTPRQIRISSFRTEAQQFSIKTVRRLRGISHYDVNIKEARSRGTGETPWNRHAMQAVNQQDTSMRS